MDSSIVVALITGTMALAGTMVSNLMANSKTVYRIEQLEKKQDIHNRVIERVYAIEKSIDVMEERQRETKRKVDKLTGE